MYTKYNLEKKCFKNETLLLLAAKIEAVLLLKLICILRGKIRDRYIKYIYIKEMYI